jgi:hypothetical protein
VRHGQIVLKIPGGGTNIEVKMRIPGDDEELLTLEQVEAKIAAALAERERRRATPAGRRARLVLDALLEPPGGPSGRVNSPGGAA